MNVLFHVNENDKWKSVLENVSNIIKEFKKNEETFSIEVVSNGGAVITLKEQATLNLKIMAELIELSKDKVVFTVCRNSLNKFDISEEELVPFIEVVPSGVLEIAKKQAEGYAYIKP